MPEEKNGYPEEFDEQGATEGSGAEQPGLTRFLIPAVVIVFLAIAVLVTNAVDSNISGAMIASISTECQDTITDLQAENLELKESCTADRQALVVRKNELEVENVKLSSRVGKLETEVGLYRGILDSLDVESVEVFTSNQGFRIIYDKYVVAKPGVESVWQAEIENIRPVRDTYSLDLRLRSAYRDAFKEEPSVIGSLNLKPANSGTLNVRLTPEDEGYAIFDIYVNGDYIGDMVVLVF